jgi:hypothetical protein
MNVKLFHPLFIIAVLCVNSIGAQINTNCFGEKEDFENLMRRKLIVELLEEDKKELRKLEDKPVRLEEYRNFISDYNQFIRASVASYWKLNTNIEYKSTTEIEQLKETGQGVFALLGYLEVGDKPMTSSPSPLVIPSLCYTRLERSKNKPDYKIYIPSTALRSNGRYVEADFKFALECMQEGVKYSITSNKTLNFPDYAEAVGKLNCGLLKEDRLVVPKSSLHMIPSEAQSYYGQPVECVEDQELNEYFIKNVPGKAALFVLPCGIIKAGYSSTLYYLKIIVECSSGRVLWTSNPGSFSFNVTQYVTEKDFRNIAKCKI